MNILDVAKKTAKSHKDGYEGMGQLMSMSPNVLRNKLSKNNFTHHLYLAEAMELMQEAEDAGLPDPHALLRAMAAELGYQLVREGAGAGASDLSLAETLLRAQQDNNEFTLSVIHAVADGDIDPVELEDIVEKRRRSGQSAVEVEDMARTFASQRGNVSPLRGAR